MLRGVLLVQGIFYVVSALWPFVHLPSFVRVVGSKPDVFQLHVTAALIVVIGAVLIVGSRRPGNSVVLLGILSALALHLAEATYWMLSKHEPYQEPGSSTEA